jgi:hypothetical protein
MVRDGGYPDPLQRQRVKGRIVRDHHLRTPAGRLQRLLEEGHRHLRIALVLNQAG